MSEPLQQQTESAPEAENIQEPSAVEKTASERREMPTEERARQAARRRAQQQRAEQLNQQTEEQRLREQVLGHPLVQDAMRLLEETRFRRDLDSVRTVYPELTAKSPDEVGEVYCRLMASGKVDPVVAYEAQLATDRRRETAPADMVSAKAAGGAALYYSSQELDRLTEKDLRDPGIFQRAMASLAKLK